jgi:general secretion pathway protein J
MSARPRRAAQGGFTLIEVLISLAIMALMMTIAWSTTSSSVQAKKFFEDFEQRNHEVRIALARMVEDLSAAYISSNQQPNLTEPRTAFVGKSSGSVEELRFSSFAHRILWAEANESEQTMISYFGDADPEERGQTNLYRRETRRLSNEGWEEVPAEIDVLVRDVEEVEFEYFDWQDNEWKDAWDTTGADAQKGRLPERVRITITIENGDGDEVEYQTQARIMLQEELKLIAN